MMAGYHTKAYYFLVQIAALGINDLMRVQGSSTAARCVATFMQGFYQSCRLTACQIHGLMSEAIASSIRELTRSESGDDESQADEEDSPEVKADGANLFSFIGRLGRQAVSFSVRPSFTMLEVRAIHGLQEALVFRWYRPTEELKQLQFSTLRPKFERKLDSAFVFVTLGSNGQAELITDESLRVWRDFSTHTVVLHIAVILPELPTRLKEAALVKCRDGCLSLQTVTIGDSPQVAMFMVREQQCTKAILPYLIDCLKYRLARSGLHSLVQTIDYRIHDLLESASEMPGYKGELPLTVSLQQLSPVLHQMLATVTFDILPTDITKEKFRCQSLAANVRDCDALMDNHTDVIVVEGSDSDGRLATDYLRIFGSTMMIGNNNFDLFALSTRQPDAGKDVTIRSKAEGWIVVGGAFDREALYYEKRPTGQPNMD